MHKIDRSEIVMTRNLLLAIGLILIVLLSGFLGYKAGFSSGFKIAETDLVSKFDLVKYTDSLSPLFQSELIYESILESNCTDGNLENVASNLLLENLQRYEVKYQSLEQKYKYRFEQQHIKTMKRIGGLK